MACQLHVLRKTKEKLSWIVHSDMSPNLFSFLWLKWTAKQSIPCLLRFYVHSSAANSMGFLSLTHHHRNPVMLHCMPLSVVPGMLPFTSRAHKAWIKIWSNLGKFNMLPSIKADLIGFQPLWLVNSLFQSLSMSELKKVWQSRSWHNLTVE